MNRHQREARKQELLTTIQTQRMDLASCQQQWIVATSRYDQIWSAAYAARRYFAIGGSLLTLWVARRPKTLGKLVKKGFGLWSSWRMIKKLIPR
ncbi:YqjK-like family protein [Rosenbergiella australiborealis]|uniref:YqjK-like protein n=1 Tax=Rosenbergiella australiborealis TaxID=1544696 RepID=A0ABS5T1M3_9GAMM|nr:YqjK-like family protein [Rosenbergiella australiborealis]MBT0726087.1 hypothetical protein [Rosenbergiella australiborealis]